MHAQIDSVALDDEEQLEPLLERTGPRIAYCPITGYPYVTARPGQRQITVEEVKAMLEDFP